MELFCDARSLGQREGSGCPEPWVTKGPGWGGLMGWEKSQRPGLTLPSQVYTFSFFSHHLYDSSPLDTPFSFPRWHQVIKNPPGDAGDVKDMGSILGLGRSPGGGHDSPRRYSCLENPMDRGAWWATVHRVVKSQTRLKRLSMHLCKTLHSCLSRWEFIPILFLQQINSPPNPSALLGLRLYPLPPTSSVSSLCVSGQGQG